MAESSNPPHKESIRFFNVQEKRAAWNEEGNRWLLLCCGCDSGADRR
ncbi:hypothetical protein [Bacteroides uniformis]|nr:hypothetical protein [Bacteroides uniformis]MDC1819691.1 hypothetical protein [Bacteroides uniformis]